MGSGSSSQRGTLSREKLVEGTKVTRHIVDIIFEYLMENIKLRDFYLLSSPEKCRKYVLFTANTLYTKFIQVQVEPQKGKDGVIFFRSVSDVTNPPKLEERLQQQKLCLQLAYFYVRILQIYGALALTLVDDSNSMVEQGYTRRLETGSTIDQPGKANYYAAGPKREYPLGPPQRRIFGGKLYDVRNYRRISSISEIRSLELFRCLHAILYVTLGDYDMRYREQKSYWIKFTKKLEDEMVDGLSAILTIEERDKDKKIQHGKLTIESGRTKVTIHVTSKPEYDSAGQIRHIYMEFYPNVTMRMEGRDKTLYDFLDTDIPHNFTFAPDGFNRVGEYDIQMWKMYVNRGKKSIEDGMQEFIVGVWDKMKLLTHPGYDKPDDRIRKPETTSDIAPTQFSEDKEVSPHLRIQPILDGMTRKRRFNHCVGRALQLLTTIPSLSGLKDTTSKAISSICDLKFSKEYVYTPTGVSLAETSSISSLANLFYDTITMGYPKPDLTIGGETMNEYVSFIKQMSELFMDKSFGDADIRSNPDEALTHIKPSQSAVCQAGDKDNRKIMLDTTFAMNTIYPHVQELWRTQLVHAANCAKIFAQLFDIRKEGAQYKVKINPNVITKGIDEVNRIAKIARNVLIAYYSNCETVYLKGVMQIEQAIQTKQPSVRFAEQEPYENERRHHRYGGRLTRKQKSK